MISGRLRGHQAANDWTWAWSDGKADMKNAVIGCLLLSILACSHSELDDVATATIGAGGGTVSLAGGIAVEIPRRALSRDTDITILRKWESIRPGSGVSAAGPVYELLPDGTTFDVPVVVTLAFSPALVPTGGEIRIMTAPTGTSAFTELPTEMVDGQRVRASTLLLSSVLAATRPSSCHGNSPCNDGNACTFNDRCVNGQCRGTPYTCDDGNVCTNNVCDGAGGCSFPPNTAPCDDGNLCTRNDTCANGACSGIAFTCNDGNVCTDDVCNGTGCTFAPNSAPCDDGNACTSNDTCSAGVCRGGSVSCCSPGPETNCTNGFDDDCDGLIDGADPDCQSTCEPIPEQCSNGLDDDCDGLVDSADPDCVLLECGADVCPYGYLCFPDSYCHSHCEDGAPDYDESDSDCGGGDCPRCQAGRHCFSGFDCASGNCLNNICQ
jgi:hypothetical protein